MIGLVRILSVMAMYGAIIAGMHFFRSGWIAILGYHVVICFILTVRSRWGLTRKLVSGWNGRWGLGISMVCLSAGLLIYFLWPYMCIDGLDLKSALASVGLEGNLWIGFMIYYCLVNPLLEELFWRGYFPARAKYSWSADFLYSGYHVFVLVLFVKWGWVVLAFVVLACVGRFWRKMADRCGGLLVPVLTHLLADISVIAAACLLARLGSGR
ncbi:type II CAAX prenyl endopeptidase Rce1 family protein [Verrucomicrobiota bacterium]